MEAAIRGVARPDEGIDKTFARLRRRGCPWNRKRVLRVYRAMGMRKAIRRRRRFPERVKRPLEDQTAPNRTWSMDFVTDTLDCGRRFRVLNVIDDHGRYALGQKVGFPLPACRVAEFLDDLVFLHGAPRSIRCDNGSGFVSGGLAEREAGAGVEIVHVQPGAPTQNACIERFNGTYRRGVLDAWRFGRIEDVEERTAEWRLEYNAGRPHEALGNLTPSEVRRRSPMPSGSCQTA